MGPQTAKLSEKWVSIFPVAVKRADYNDFDSNCAEQGRP